VIGYLQGRLFRTSPNVLLVDVGGVGYELHIPLSTYYQVQKVEEGAAVALFVHTHVREDALQLFGFWTEGERRMFEKLIAVTGIGPRLAQTVLSGMSSSDLVSALGSGDVRRLATIPGIGKKTAERMVLELKDKVGDVGGGEAPAPAPSAERDLAEALINLGYRRSAAEKAIARVTREDPEGAFADHLRSALKILSRI